MDLLIVVLVAFNIILGIMMIVALAMFIGILREVREIVRDAATAYRYVKNLEFLPAAVAGIVLEHFFGKSKKGE